MMWPFFMRLLPRLVLPFAYQHGLSRRFLLRLLFLQHVQNADAVLCLRLYASLNESALHFVLLLCVAV